MSVRAAERERRCSPGQDGARFQDPRLKFLGVALGATATAAMPYLGLNDRGRARTASRWADYVHARGG